MRIGIDLGGSKVEVAVLDDYGHEIHRERTSTPTAYEDIIDAVVAMVQGADEIAGDDSTVGIGTPGSVLPATGVMKNSNTQALNGRSLPEDLESAVGRPIRLANDADCFALSEAVDGAGQGLGTVFGVILGTGVGGGLIVDGKPLSGPNGIAGEWGHNPLPMRPEELPGRDCYCSRSGCVETWLSGPGLEADHLRATGETLAAKEIASAASDGDQRVAETIDRYADRLARALAVVINIVDPDLVVLGGGVSNIDALYDLVPSHWGRYVFSDEVRTRLARAVHGDSSGVRGAARLWEASSG